MAPATLTKATRSEAVGWEGEPGMAGEKAERSVAASARRLTLGSLEERSQVARVRAHLSSKARSRGEAAVDRDGGMVGGGGGEMDGGSGGDSGGGGGMAETSAPMYVSSAVTLLFYPNGLRPKPRGTGFWVTKSCAGSDYLV
eukprot:874098-Prymnesium_polylepis.1